MTDALITYLTDHDAARHVLKFHGGAGKTQKAAKVNGMSQSDYHRMIAVELIKTHPSGKWKDTSVKYLTQSVKNRFDQ